MAYLSHVEFDSSYIYAQCYEPARVLEIDADTGIALWHDGEVRNDHNSVWINSRGTEPTEASTQEVIQCLAKAMCSLNSRMKSGF